MKDQVVLDNTAILTLLAMEEGPEVIAENLENTVVSSVILSEVITILVRRGLKHGRCSSLIFRASANDTNPALSPYFPSVTVLFFPLKT